VKKSHPEIEVLLIESLRDALPACQAVYRFGSWGSEAERPDSDIDLAVLPSTRMETVFRWELAQRLASIAGRDVDLVDLSSASTVLRMQVIAHGERLFCADEFFVEQFEDAVFSGYARLNEERAGILSDVYQRGSVFG
jgi:uncharacterized protein